MDELQKWINKMLGIDQETWEKYGPVSPEAIETISLKSEGLKDGATLQKFINNLMGISDEVWEKYGPKQD